MSRAGAEVRLGRLLAIVPWVAAQDGPTIEEVCRRFEVSEKELVADLEMLFMCGVYPFTPDVLIEVTIAAGRVWIKMADYFRRPLKLDKQEALALVSAGKTFLQMPGAGSNPALASAVDKLEAVLGMGGEGALDVELGAVRSDVLDAVRGAAARREKVRIGYYTYGRDEFTTRVVHPGTVFNSAGQWYLRGWCENVGGERTFRLDRVTDLEVTGEPFEPRPAGSPPTGSGGGVAPGSPPVFQPGPEDPVWVLDLQRRVHWIAEQYPMDAVEDRGGGVLRVHLRAASPAWVERLLLRAGPDAELVEGDPGVRAAAAGRLLRRYQAG